MRQADHLASRPPSHPLGEQGSGPLKAESSGRQTAVLSAPAPSAAADRLSLSVSRCRSPATQSIPYFEVHAAYDGEWMRLRLTGELDMASAPELSRRLTQLRSANRAVRLDLSELEFIDSTGVQVLVAALKDASEDGWQLAIDPALSPAVDRIFKLTGLDRVIPGCGGNSR